MIPPEPLTTENERRLCAILHEKWERISDMEFRRGNFRIKSVTDAWESYIKGLGMTFLALESSEPEFRKSLDPEDGNHYAVDPVSLNPTYIVVPGDLALKILALEWMP